MAKNSNFPVVSIRFFKIIFCPTSWLILKQLDNSPSLSMSDSELGCASLTISVLVDNSDQLGQVRARYLIVK